MQADILSQQGLVVKEIDGKQYTLKLLPATEAIITGQELIKLIAVPLGSAFDSGALEGEITDIDFGKNIAMALVSALQKADVVTLIKRLVHGLQVDGVPVDFDTHFQGKNLSKLPKVISWSIEENGINPMVFMNGFSEMGGVDITQALSTMSQKSSQESTSQK
jgi:hypothetical protein